MNINVYFIAILLIINSIVSAEETITINRNKYQNESFNFQPINDLDRWFYYGDHDEQKTALFDKNISIKNKSIHINNSINNYDTWVHYHFNKTEKKLHSFQCDVSTEGIQNNTFSVLFCFGNFNKLKNGNAFGDIDKYNIIIRFNSKYQNKMNPLNYNIDSSFKKLLNNISFKSNLYFNYIENNNYKLSLIIDSKKKKYSVYTSISETYVMKLSNEYDIFNDSIDLNLLSIFKKKHLNNLNQHSICFENITFSFIDKME